MGVAVDSKTGDVYVADAKGDRVDVFEPEGPGARALTGLVIRTSARRRRGWKRRSIRTGLDTHLFFEYGTADCRATPSACTQVPAPPGVDVAEGFGAQNASAVEGLTPETDTSTGRSPSTRTAKRKAQTLSTFTTPPNGGDALADGRAWELVSPAEKDGALIYPIGGTTENGGPASGVIEAANDGTAVTYTANAPIGEGVAGNRSLEAAQVISTRPGDGPRAIS